MSIVRGGEVFGNYDLRKEEVQGRDACNGSDCHVGGGFGGFADHTGGSVENLVGNGSSGGIAWANEGMAPDFSCVEEDSSDESVVDYLEQPA